MEKRMSWIIVMLALVAMLGCAGPSTITFGPNGKISSATNYLIGSQDGPFTPNIADNWFTGAAKQILDGLGTYLAMFKGLQPVTPTPVPAPVPVPTPTPYPAPAPTPTPTPGPILPPTASSVFPVQGSTITLDLNTLPGSMRASGFQGSDNALYYALAFVFAYGPGSEMPDDGAGSLVGLNKQRQQIFSWFDVEVLKVINLMKANANLNIVAITGDGKDRCGFRLGPAIVAKVSASGLGGRVKLGTVLDPSKY